MGSNKQGNTTLTLMNINYYLSSELTDQGYGAVNIFEAYPDTTDDDFVSQLPGLSISVGHGDSEGDQFELGNSQEMYARPVQIDVFTEPRADAQLADLLDIIKDFFKKEKIFDFLNWNAATPYPVTNKIKIQRTRSTILATPPTVYNHGIVTFDAIVIE